MQPRFYFDLRSPDAWLASELVVSVLGQVPEFVPVELAGLAAGDVGPYRCAAEVDAAFEELGRRAAHFEVIPLRRPDPFPFEDTHYAMLAATYAKQIGKVVAFSLGAFRQSFAAGRDLADRDTVFLAGAAAEIHPAAIIKGTQLKSTQRRLQAATAEAAELGVLDVPAVFAAGRVFHGVDELPLAAEALA